MALGIILRRSARRVGGETRRCCRPCSTGFDRSRLVSLNNSIYTLRQFSTNPNSDDSVVNVLQLQLLRNELKLLREDIESLRKGNDRPIIKEKIEENVNDSLLNGDQKATTKMIDFILVESVHDAKIEESDYESIESDIESIESDIECSEETVVPNGEEQQHNTENGNPLLKKIEPNGEEQQQNTENENPLLKKIESEIKFAEEFSRLCSKDTKFPDDFPFKVEKDIDGVREISLSQLYQGERIDINIAPPCVYNGNHRSTAQEYYEDFKYSNYAMRATVEVSCANSNRRKVAFDCSAHRYGYQIENVKNPGDGADSEGLRFSDLHKGLQEEFKKYLEIRGIKPAATKVLYGYMVDKANRERLIFYNKFKKVLEDTGCTRP